MFSIKNANAIESLENATETLRALSIKKRTQ